ncbi:nuclear transport factor 2 family protein [Pseudofulvibacter geojedonensis]|uniref:Nuclear transport factor 2 family protein n=1 Tax=Pseudofulvibacter geojedonensis TaxID=1123758 RepID=A0ABW3I166_9FLAO
MTQKETIEKFYKAFQELDVKTMNSCYHKNIEFTDPGFGTLYGDEARNMWIMICERAKNFSLTYSKLTESSAHWEAKYDFSKTRRKVHNKIDAYFEFKDGLIIKHLDTFNLHKWASQALGFKGWLLGGTPFFKKKLNRQTKQMLVKYMQK